jgi:hypothetical protein
VRAADPRAPELKRAGLTDLARPTPLIGAFALDPPPPRGFPRAPRGYPHPLRGTTGALRPRSTWAPIAYTTYISTGHDIHSCSSARGGSKPADSSTSRPQAADRNIRFRDRPGDRSPNSTRSNRPAGSTSSTGRRSDQWSVRPATQGSARSPSPKPKSDSAAADFTKVQFSGPEVQVQFRVGLRSPSPSPSPIRVGPRSPSPSPSPIREWTSKWRPSPTTSPASATGFEVQVQVQVQSDLDFEVHKSNPKSDSARHSQKAGFGCVTFCTQ